MPSPYLCERFHPTRGCSRRKYLFLNFANATPRMQFAKVAPPGFELEALLLSLSQWRAPRDGGLIIVLLEPTRHRG